MVRKHLLNLINKINNTARVMRRVLDLVPKSWIELGTIEKNSDPGWN